MSDHLTENINTHHIRVKATQEITQPEGREITKNNNSIINVNTIETY